QWLGVADIMRAEAHEEANAVLDRHAARSSSITGVMPQRVIREGEKAQEVLNLIEDDEDIAILVLAAATSKEGPGPLVSSISKTAGDFPIPVAIVPGHLSDEELDAMSCSAPRSARREVRGQSESRGRVPHQAVALRPARTRQVETSTARRHLLE